MNIKELAIQCGMFNEASILNAALFDKSLNDFAQAVIAQFISEQKPVAWMNDKTPSGVFARHKEGADNFGCTVPLYTLGGQP